MNILNISKCLVKVFYCEFTSINYIYSFNNTLLINIVNDSVKYLCITLT